MQSDRFLHQRVLEELANDGIANRSAIEVAVNQDIVTLSGQVTSWAQKLAATEAAHRVRGVREVANDLRVVVIESERRTDVTLASAIREALRWSSLVPADEVVVSVEDGVVTLRGSVSTEREREAAVNAVAYVVGVRSIDNQLVVERPALSRERLQEIVIEALASRREWNRITVELDDGRATVSGLARSWSEHRAILDAVRSTPGVIDVIDLLRV